MSEPTVKRALRELVEADFVVKVTRWRDNGGQSSNLYILRPIEKSVETPANTVENNVESSASSFEQEKTPMQYSNVPEQPADEEDNSPQEAPETALKEDKLPVQDNESSHDVDANESLYIREQLNDTLPANRCTSDNTQKHNRFSFILPVLRQISCFLPKKPLFSAFMTPTPGHEFTPKVKPYR